VELGRDEPHEAAMVLPSSGNKVEEGVTDSMLIEVRRCCYVKLSLSRSTFSAIDWTWKVSNVYSGSGWTC
jgi:hypothetical protein